MFALCFEFSLSWTTFLTNFSVKCISLPIIPTCIDAMRSHYCKLSLSCETLFVSLSLHPSSSCSSPPGLKFSWISHRCVYYFWLLLAVTPTAVLRNGWIIFRQGYWIIFFQEKWQFLCLANACWFPLEESLLPDTVCLCAVLSSGSSFCSKLLF